MYGDIIYKSKRCVNCCFQITRSNTGGSRRQDVDTLVWFIFNTSDSVTSACISHKNKWKVLKHWGLLFLFKDLINARPSVLLMALLVSNIFRTQTQIWNKFFVICCCLSFMLSRHWTYEENVKSLKPHSMLSWTLIHHVYLKVRGVWNGSNGWLFDNFNILMQSAMNIKSPTLSLPHT